MKILIVGLPLFAERLKKELSEFDQSNTYYQLNTYYNRKDKIKAFFMMPFMDVVFSINGTTTKSKVIDLALFLKKRVMFNWVGTDVLKAINNHNRIQSYISKVEHYCEVEWIQEELKPIGINAEILNFVAFEKSFELPKLDPKQLNVLSYISDKRAEFYGINEFLELAKQFPSINFFIAGTNAEKYEPLPSNLKALGWVDDMNALFDKVHVTVRFPEHDGLSSFILESMARGKQVIYKYPFNHCLYCESLEQMIQTVQTIKVDFEAGKDLTNRDAKIFIESNFSKEKIFSELIKKWAR